MNEFLTSNEPKYRLARTIVQGLLGVVVTVLPQVVGLWQLDSTTSAAVVAVVMAVLSPLMAAMGDSEEA